MTLHPPRDRNAAVPALPADGPPRRGATARRLACLALALAVLAAACAAGVAIGSVNLPLSTVRDALTGRGDGIDHLTVRTLRVPRTALAVLVGAALGVAGALIQGLTRNPLADPGVLGVNAGAQFAIVLAVAVLGVTRIEQYLWYGFGGAVAAAVVVHLIAASGPGGATPLRLTLVGVALSAVLMGAAQTLALADPETFDRMRYWGVGTVADRPGGTLATVWPFVLAGIVLAFACARGLNALALGDDVARALGARIAATRVAGVLAVTLLCGAATAAAGPIGFVGLMVPHAVRAVTGPDQRWVLPFSLVLGPVLVLLSDILGRVVIRPAELQVGVVTAFLGAPVLIALVRRATARVP